MRNGYFIAVNKFVITTIAFCSDDLYQILTAFNKVLGPKSSLDLSDFASAAELSCKMYIPYVGTARVSLLVIGSVSNGKVKS